MATASKPKSASKPLEFFDKEGNRRISIGMIPGKGKGKQWPSLSMFDSEGRNRLMLYLTDDGWPCLLFRDKDGDKLLLASGHEGLTTNEPSHGEFELFCADESAIKMQVARESLRGYWPVITLQDTERNTVAELGGSADKSTVSPYYFRVVAVKLDGEWGPDSDSDVPSHATVVEVLHEGTEIFDEAAAFAQGFNFARMEEVEQDPKKKLVRWACVVPPDQPLEIGAVGRRRVATFCNQGLGF